MSQSSGTEQSYQQRQRQLTCHRDTDAATGVCGECGSPLCADHQNEIRDPVFSHFIQQFSYLGWALGLLVVLPVAWFVVDPIALLGEQDVSVPAGTGTFVLHSSVLLGLAFGFTLWSQGADRKTSARFLRRTPPTRILCEDCHADTAVRRIIYYGLLGLAGLLVVVGVYLAWDGESISSLRVSTLGLALYVVRSDATMFLNKLIE
jgi:hypothetical protein